MGPIAFNDGTSPESTAVDCMVSQDRTRTRVLGDDALVERFAPVSMPFGLYNDEEDESVIAEPLCVKGLVTELSIMAMEGVGDTAFTSRIEDSS